MIELYLMEEFTKWLEEELRTRNWQPSDLARRAKLGNSTLTRILNGIRNPGPEVCVAIARALDHPPEHVFRVAGLLPPLPSSNDGFILKELIEIVKRLPDEDREEVLDYAKMRYEKRQKKKKPPKPTEVKSRPASIVQRIQIPKGISPEVAEKVRAAVEKLTPDERAAWIEELFYRRHIASGSQTHGAEGEIEASQPDRAAKPRAGQE